MTIFILLTIQEYRACPIKHSCKILHEKVFFLASLQDLARSCRILRDLAGLCRNLAGILHKIPARFLQNPARSCIAKYCKILQGCKKKGPFLIRSCKSVFTGCLYVTGFRKTDPNRTFGIFRELPIRNIKPIVNLFARL